MARMVSGSVPNPGRRTVALGPVRHACHSCGSCCTGWRVRLLDDEAERIAAHAAELGVADPIVEGSLRQVDARCVFLGADRLCQIHARFGADAKPRVCQLYPRRYVRTEDAVRVGADPGCSSTWRSFRDGPIIDFEGPAFPIEVKLPPELATTEDNLINLARHPGMHFATFVGIVSGDTSHLPGLSPALIGRLLAQLKPLDDYFEHPSAGPFILADLASPLAVLRAFDTAAAPPALTIADDVSALALEIIQRTLFLRLGDKRLPPMGQLMLLLSGIVLCALAEPRLERFGPALAAWSRTSLLPGFWHAFIPDTSTARYLLTGERPPAGQERPTV